MESQKFYDYGLYLLLNTNFFMDFLYLKLRLATFVKLTNNNVKKKKGTKLEFNQFISIC